eukprot:366176-Chlamydomonas_euryale.AAC.4
MRAQTLQPGFGDIPNHFALRRHPEPLCTMCAQASMCCCSRTQSSRMGARCRWSKVDDKRAEYHAERGMCTAGTFVRTCAQSTSASTNTKERGFIVSACSKRKASWSPHTAEGVVIFSARGITVPARQPPAYQHRPHQAAGPARQEIFVSASPRALVRRIAVVVLAVGGRQFTIGASLCVLVRRSTVLDVVLAVRGRQFTIGASLCVLVRRSAVLVLVVVLAVGGRQFTVRTPPRVLVHLPVLTLGRGVCQRTRYAPTAAAAAARLKPRVLCSNDVGGRTAAAVHVQQLSVGAEEAVAPARKAACERMSRHAQN